MPLRDAKPMQAASSEVVRDINRRIVLNLIRTRQPISRADLARLSGMQRSTISLIVEELVAEHWVLEGPTGRLPRGRRPTFLRLNDERVIIAADIRPLQMTVALADVNGKFSSQEAMATPADPKVALDLLIQRVQPIIRACRTRKIEGIGITLPGRVDDSSDRLVFAPNIGWRDVELGGPIARATGLEVELENAANACVLAAVWFDHMETSGNLVVVTVSEGLGTGILMNGRLARGLNGMAGEFGHVPLDPKGPLCSCGSRGCWEVFGSNRAAIRYYHESGSPENQRQADAPRHASAEQSPIVLNRAPGPVRSWAGGLSFPDLLSLADQGDARAARALETMARYLGRGMRMIVAGLAPERIIVIGDLTRSWYRFGPIIESEVKAQILPGCSPPRLIPVHEDGMARLRGAVALVLQKHFGAGREVAA